MQFFTQLFFDNDKFYNYLQLLQENGIEVPVAAGIMPVRSYKQIIKDITCKSFNSCKSFKTKLISIKMIRNQ